MQRAVPLMLDFFCCLCQPHTSLATVPSTSPSSADCANDNSSLPSQSTYYFAQIVTLTPLKHWLASCLGAARPGGLCSGLFSNKKPAMQCAIPLILSLFCCVCHKGLSLLSRSNREETEFQGACVDYGLLFEEVMVDVWHTTLKSVQWQNGTTSTFPAHMYCHRAVRMPRGWRCALRRLF